MGTGTENMKCQECNKEKNDVKPREFNKNLNKKYNKVLLLCEECYIKECQDYDDYWIDRYFHA